MMEIELTLLILTVEDKYFASSRISASLFDEGISHQGKFRQHSSICMEFLKCFTVTALEVVSFECFSRRLRYLDATFSAAAFHQAGIFKAIRDAFSVYQQAGQIDGQHLSTISIQRMLFLGHGRSWNSQLSNSESKNIYR